MSDKKIHTFDNGVMVYDEQLIPKQRERYRIRNVHEADEEDIFIELIKKISGGGRYVNIGSAIGYYPLLAKRLAPNLEVHAIEPFEMHRRHFLDNIRLNGLTPNDFHIHGIAISGKDGYSEFIESGYGSKLDIKHESIKRKFKSLLKGRIFHMTSDKAAQRQKVKTLTLDSFVESIGSAPIDLVQIDIQGLEAKVLASAPKSLAESVGHFLIGTHGTEIHKECLRLFQEAGFAIDHDNPYTPHQPDGIIVARR